MTVKFLPTTRQPKKIFVNAQRTPAIYESGKMENFLSTKKSDYGTPLKL